MFVSRFSNNRRLMVFKSDVCKPLPLNIYSNYSTNMDINNTHHLFNFNLLTSKILTNISFNQQNSDLDKNALKENSLNLSLCYHASKFEINPATKSIEPEKEKNNMFDMYTYLVDLVRNFFSNWNGSKQNSQNLSFKNKDCDVINIEPTSESSCDTTGKFPQSKEKNNKKSLINETLISKHFNVNNINVEDMLIDPVSLKFSRETSRLQKLKKKKHKKMATKTKNKEKKSKDKCNFWDCHINSAAENYEDFIGSCSFDIISSPVSIPLLYSLSNPENSPDISPSFLIGANGLISFSEDSICSSFENVSRKSRNISECESEDSFIIFTSDEFFCRNNHFESDIEEEDSFTDTSENYQDQKDCTNKFQQTQNKSEIKKVSFANDKNLCTVHRLVKWSYAYQAARKGPWEEYARDRERFAFRIQKLEPKLTEILDPELREKIYKERFMGI